MNGGVRGGPPHEGGVLHMKGFLHMNRMEG